MATPSITAQQSPITDKAAASEGETVSEIQSLILRAQDLTKSVDWWNTAMIWGLAIAAIAAVFVLISTRVVVAKSKELSNIQDRLSNAKDKQLALDLKAKDSQIELAKKGAAEATATAKGFESQIAASDARAKVAEAEAAKANLELVRLRTPRTLDTGQQQRIVKGLEFFPDIPFDLTVYLDSESVDFMRTVKLVLSTAKWKQVAAKGPIGLGNSDPLIGLSVSTGVLVVMSNSGTGGQRWADAIDKLVGLLKAEHVDASGTIAMTGVEPNAVHITIGKKM